MSRCLCCTRNKPSSWWAATFHTAGTELCLSTTSSHNTDSRATVPFTLVRSVHIYFKHSCTLQLHRRQPGHFTPREGNTNKRARKRANEGTMAKVEAQTQATPTKNRSTLYLQTEGRTGNTPAATNPARDAPETHSKRAQKRKEQRK